MGRSPRRDSSRLLRALRIAYSEMFDFARIRSRAARILIAPFFVLPTFIFVQRLLGLDRRLRAGTLPNAMSWVLRKYYGGVSHHGRSIPPTGPLLLVGNHPGLGDLPALAVAAGRDDLVAVAKRRALTERMGGVLDRCILIDSTLASRAAALRSIMRVLGGGGAVVIYPAGAIEPDPAIFNGRSDFLSEWPPFVDGIVRRARREGLDVPVVPVYSEGVHHVPRGLRCLLGPASEHTVQEGRAALVTMASRLARAKPVRIVVGEPLRPDGEHDAQSDALTRRVRRVMVELHRVASATEALDTRPARPAAYPLGLPEAEPRPASR